MSKKRVSKAPKHYQEENPSKRLEALVQRFSTLPPDSAASVCAGAEIRRTRETLGVQPPLEVETTTVRGESAKPSGEVAQAVSEKSTALATFEKNLADAPSHPETDLPVVVYMHGIGNQEPPKELKRIWDVALFGVDMGARTRMAYWADLRPEQGVPSSAGPMSVRALSLESAESPEEARFAQELYDRMVAANSERATSGVRTAGVREKVLPDFIRGPVSKWILQQFVKDVALYFFNEEKRGQIQERVRALLAPREKVPYLVIGHSLGSVIAFDVLSSLKEADDVHVLHYVTLGSPLGIEEVQDHLSSKTMPAVVQSWHNFCDLRDPVALDKTLADEFSRRADQSLEDTRVSNLEFRPPFSWNPHAAKGYLGTDAVRQDVESYVGPNFAAPVAKFLVARDVANEASDQTSRHPVLIEVTGQSTGSDLAEKVEKLAGYLSSIVSDKDSADIDPLRRYVAARLNASELHKLERQAETYNIGNVWKNARKRTLLDVSNQTLQAYTARVGYRASGNGIAWAVLDTGVEWEHPHFAVTDAIAAMWDCARAGKPQQVPKTKGTKFDGDGHGTHVCGIIAGRSQGDKYSGIAPETKLHVYKVLNDKGEGDDSWIIKAIDHIADLNDSSPELKIHGVNLSLGGPFDASVYGCGFSPLCNELRRLWRQGVVVCIAAGNEGQLRVSTDEGFEDLNFSLSIGDPANLDEAIAVGSVHKERPHTYGVSYFSSRGPTADGRIKPDVVAPGEKIVSCNFKFRGGNEYVPMSGTSMACPHVSGLLAAFLSVRREFVGYPDKAKEILVKHCIDLSRNAYHQGAGMPNLVKMLMET